MGASFVDDGFAVPVSLVTERFVLEPLGPEHNESDYAAWTSSIAHIRSTPGFTRPTWPYPLSLEQNKADLEGHAREFRERVAFAYTVLDPVDRSVIGCVYLRPPGRADEDVPPGTYDVSVRSWVRADHRDLDKPLWLAVSEWLDQAWPFARIGYARRV